jgi:dienelactone hydrolase
LAQRSRRALATLPGRILEGSAMTAAPVRFRDRTLTLRNGSVGTNIEIASASPVNYYQAISRADDMASVTIDGKLFLPAAGPQAGGLPLVIVVPGSLGIAGSHLSHAETITTAGIAALLLDPFGARGVASTVANQTQYSFAASAYDVLAAFRAMSACGTIDAARIGAQGHSRGGSAVLTAATRRFADAVIGRGRGLKSVLAAYPWCGHQFLDPAVGTTEIRILMGDRDDWCSPMQVQGHAQAVRLAGGAASLRLFGGATHSFDRATPVERIAEAAVSPAAPTAYIADDGAFIHPLHSAANPELVDRDLMVYALKAGYGTKGATLGSRGDEADLFRTDMLAYWRRTLLT